MTRDEFLSAIKERGAHFAPAASTRDISLANSSLQQMRCAMLPKIMMDLFSITGGINLGTGYIFGPTDITNGIQYPTPSIVRINQDFSHLTQMRGKTIFGRNDLFFFAFDTFGTCFMLDNLNLTPMRKYDDAMRALSDCLIAGKL